MTIMRLIAIKFFNQLTALKIIYIYIYIYIHSNNNNNVYYYYYYIIIIIVNVVLYMSDLQVI